MKASVLCVCDFQNIFLLYQVCVYVCVLVCVWQPTCTRIHTYNANIESSIWTLPYRNPRMLVNIKIHDYRLCAPLSMPPSVKATALELVKCCDYGNSLNVTTSIGLPCKNNPVFPPSLKASRMWHREVVQHLKICKEIECSPSAQPSQDFKLIFLDDSDLWFCIKKHFSLPSKTLLDNPRLVKSLKVFPIYWSSSQVPRRLKIHQCGSRGRRM